MNDDTHNLVSPVFNGVFIDAADRGYDTNTASPAVTTGQRVRFLGTYKSTAFSAEDKSILLMGAENTLYYPLNGASIGAQRAYFKIGADGATGARLTAFNIDFGDDTTTGIREIGAEANSSPFILHSSLTEGWYDLQGRKLDKQPTRKGLYIVNGRTVVIK